jgi:hypothetical protein
MFSYLQDLAALVDSQQEQIDKVAEQTEEAKETTRSGLEHIQQSVMGLCGPVSSSDPKNNDFQKLRVGEEFKWTMPFETISDDMRASAQDVFKFGRDILEDIQENVETMENPIACAPVTFDNCHDMRATQPTDMRVS